MCPAMPLNPWAAIICSRSLSTRYLVMDGDNVKVSVSVAYLDQTTKATQVSQFDLILAKMDGNWKIIGVN